MSHPRQNWAKTVAFSPRAWHEPDDEAGVAAVLRGVGALAGSGFSGVKAGDGRRVRVVGAAHSWSDAAACDDVLIGLGRLTGIVSLEGDLVRVRAGTPLHQLNTELAAAGRALPILGTITAQSVAGAVSTGTHGSSLRHGNLASLVVGMRLVDASGSVRTIGPDDPDLPALRVGLGAFGVLTELTLRTVPAFRLHERLTPLRWDEALDVLPELVRVSPYLKLWWMPHTDHALIFRYEPTEGAITAPAVPRSVDEHLVNGLVFPGLLGLSRLFPALASPINQLVRRVYFQPQERVAPSYEALTAVMPPRHREVEHSVPFESTITAIRQIRSFIETERLSVNFPLEARFGPADDAWMSPSYGRESCHLGTYIGECRDRARYFEGSTQILRALGGRPHWGKEHTLAPGEARRIYPRAADFAARVAAWDPEGRFATPFVRRVLSQENAG